MNYSSYNRGTYKPKKRRIRRKSIVLLIVATLFISGGVWFFFDKQKAHSPSQPNTEQTTELTESTTSEPQLPNLQPVVDEFIASHAGSYAIRITDVNGNSLAEKSGDKSDDMASLYKLLVAYIGYQSIDNGTYALSEPYLNGYTRGECLDAMIRDSNSPCGEKMMAEIGGTTLNQKAKEYGLKNTSYGTLTTTPDDMAVLLAHIENGKDLSVQSRASYLDSMKTQDALYRRGLPSGFTSSTVYNKVGWRGVPEWHDVAIVELNNGQKIIVAVMTQGAGYANIANFGAALEKALQ